MDEEGENLSLPDKTMKTPLEEKVKEFKFTIIKKVFLEPYLHKCITKHDD